MTCQGYMSFIKPQKDSLKLKNFIIEVSYLR